MASAHIELGTNTRLGAELRGMVDSLQRLNGDYNDAKAVFDQLALGGDWTSLGAALGLTGASAATDAQAIYNLLGSVLTELNGPFTAQWLGRLG